MNLDLLKQKLDTIQNRSIVEEKRKITQQSFGNPTIGKQQVRYCPFSV